MHGNNHKQTSRWNGDQRHPVRLLLAVFLLLVGLMSTALVSTAGAAIVEGVRMWASPDSTRLVLDISDAVDHKVFLLKGPDRLVVDLKDATLFSAPAGLDYSGSMVSGLRSAPRNGTDLRLVLDLKGKIRPKSFLLKPTQQYGHRLVIDLEQLEANRAPKAITHSAENATKDAPRNVIVAIDAGHGGEDPGALGRHGTREKDVVLSIARRLEDLINRQHGMQAVMIRTGDYYISLRKRMQLAREKNADLFVSIHADAFRDERAKGTSVYVLSQKGATSEAARWLAESENSSDLLGGVSLDDKDDLLASVLLDLSQNATIATSLDVGKNVLHELGRVGKVHRHSVEQAGFVVLKSPDMPSILVETGYISNRQEEKNLRDANHQYKLAHAMLQGIRSYFEFNPPPGTLLAMADRQHVIRRGDTLSDIAARYQVSQLALRSVNQLGDTDVLFVGQTLRIPSM